MNDDDLSTQLQQVLQPRGPSSALMERLQAARPRQGRRLAGALRFRRWGLALALPAAAALVVLGLVKWTARPVPHPVAARNTGEIFLPVELRREVVKAEPGDLIQLPGLPPLQFIRVLWRDEVTAVSAEDDAGLKLEGYRQSYVPVVAKVY